MKTKKNIWIFNHYAVTPDIPGSTRHHDFAKQLIKRGYRVAIFASSFNHKLKKDVKITTNNTWKIENINDVNFVWLKTYPYQQNNWRRLLNIFSYLYRALRVGVKITTKVNYISKPDTIIGSTIHPLAALAAYWLSQKYSAQFILEIRDLWPQSLIDTGKLRENSLITIILKLLEKFLSRKARKIIILASTTKKYLISLQITPEKIYLIPNGVNLSLYPLKNHQPKNNKLFKIMYTGSISFVNALKPALKAMCLIQQKNLQNIKMILSGSGSEKDLLKKISQQLKLTNLEFRDPVPKSKIPALLQEADIFLLMENKILYGSSNKLMDYLSSGKPIIFSTYATHNTLQKINCGLVVPPQDHRKLAQAIIKLYYTPPAERDKMGKNGREYAQKYHDITVLVNKLEKVLL